MAITSELYKNNELTIRFGSNFCFIDHTRLFKVFRDIRKIGAITFDFQNTNSFDSSAFGMLLLFRDFAYEHKISIELINLQPEIKRLFKAAQFDMHFHYRLPIDAQVKANELI